jgi:hypothetical protein
VGQAQFGGIERQRRGNDIIVGHIGILNLAAGAASQ